MISVSQASEIVSANTPQLGDEIIRLENSVGRILRCEVRADMDMPPFNRSQMDGYAVKAADLTALPVRLKIVGESAAGKNWEGELQSGEAVRIMTGAAVPNGADAVQKHEVTSENGDFVEIFEAVRLNQNIVSQASEIARDAKIFDIGERISTAMITGLAAFGYGSVKVGKRPRVGILSTGNEIVGVDETPQKNQIRNSNSPMLNAYVEQCGAAGTILPIISDDPDSLQKAVTDAARVSDVLILTGGVSVGKYDFTKPALLAAGAEILFDKVALRPGKPTVFGRLGETLIFGLPGNPVSAAVTFNLFARTALLQMQGGEETKLKSGWAILDKSVNGIRGRDSYLPAQTSVDDKGQTTAKLLDWGGSSDFVSFARADALILVPQNKKIDAGDIAEVYYLQS